jgi:hypothetical protein
VQQQLSPNLFDLGFNQLFLVFRWPFPFVGNDTRNSRRDSGIARRSPRFRSPVQYFFSFPLHSNSSPEQIPERKKN